MSYASPPEKGYLLHKFTFDKRSEKCPICKKCTVTWVEWGEPSRHTLECRGCEVGGAGKTLKAAVEAFNYSLKKQRKYMRRAIRNV